MLPWAATICPSHWLACSRQHTAGIARGAWLHCAGLGCWDVGFFNFPVTEETAGIPSQIHHRHCPSHTERGMHRADSALGLDCHPKCVPALGEAAKVRIIPVQSSAGCYTTAAHSLEKPKAKKGRRGQCRQGRAVHPAELFAITTLSMLCCADRDCRHCPYLLCKPLIIQQH